MMRTAFALSLLALALSSCYSSYVPNLVHAPLLSHPNETVISGSATLAGYYGLHVAHSIDSEWAVATSLNYLHGQSSSDDSKGSYFELSGGHYQVSNGVFHEWFAGVGYETIDRDAEEVFSEHASGKDWHFHNRFLKVFGETDFGYTDGLASGGFAGRISYLQDLPHPDSSAMTLEPVLFARVGRDVQFLLQYGISIGLFERVRTLPFVWSIGLSLRLQ